MASTVAQGSLPSSCNNVRPYYYNGYYYVFYKSDSTIYYKKSSDGENWDSAVSVQTGVDYRWALMGKDDKFLLSWVDPPSVYAKVGTIQADHTISWGSASTLGSANDNNRQVHNYVTEVSGTRKYFSRGSPSESDQLFVSDNDGSSWSDLGSCVTNSGQWWFQVQVVPFADGNKVQVIYSKAYDYYIKTVYRDGSSCGSEVNLGGFRNQHYISHQAIGILVGNYVHLFYIDDNDNLLHKRVTAGGSWETVGTVKSGMDADAGLSAAYDADSGKLYIFYYEGTSLKFKTWDGANYSSETTVLTGESDILYLTAYPYKLNSEILLNWYDGTNVRFHKISLAAVLEKSLEEILSFSPLSCFNFSKVLSSFLNLTGEIHFPSLKSQTLEDFLNLSDSVFASFLKEVIRQELINLTDKIANTIKHPLCQVLSLVGINYPGWLDGWQYRKPLNISSVEGAGKNYPIKIKVHFGSGTDSNDDVYLDGHCRTDFGDIRFTDKYGSALLDYWMETKIDSDYAIFWVEVPDDLSIGDTKIYLYYGKWDAATTHDNLGLDLWQLREYDYSSSYDPDFLFDKPESSVLRIDSYTNGASSHGRGYAFIQAKRQYLHGKKLKICWKVYYSYPEVKSSLGTVYIIDNPHLRTKTTEEFVDNEDIEHPLSDYTNLLALSIDSSGSEGWTNWTTSTSSVLDLSNFSSDYVTILIRLVDGWTGQTTMLDIDYLQILDSSDNVLKTFDFTESVNMEQTGTTRDYGLYRKKVSPEPSKTWGSTEHMGPYFERYFESIQFLSVPMKTTIFSLKETFNLLATFVQAVKTLKVFEVFTLVSTNFFKTQIRRAESLLLSSLFYRLLRIYETVNFLSSLLPFKIQKVCSESLGNWLRPWKFKTRVYLDYPSQLTDVTVKFELRHEEGVSHDNVLYDMKTSKSDLSDIRFVSEGQQLEALAGMLTGSTRKFYIRLPKVPTFVDIFFSNPDASVEKNEDVFDILEELWDSYSLGTQEPGDWVLETSPEGVEDAKVIADGYDKCYYIYTTGIEVGEGIATLRRAITLDFSKTIKLRARINTWDCWQGTGPRGASSLLGIISKYTDNSVKILAYKVGYTTAGSYDRIKFQGTTYTPDKVVSLGDFESWKEIEVNITNDWEFSTENIDSLYFFIGTAAAGTEGTADGAQIKGWFDEIGLWEDFNLTYSYEKLRKREIFWPAVLRKENLNLSPILFFKSLIEETIQLISVLNFKASKVLLDSLSLLGQFSSASFHGWLLAEALAFLDSQIFSSSKLVSETLKLKDIKGLPYSQTLSELFSIVSTFLRKKIPSIYLIVRKRRLPWGTFFGWTPPFYRSDFLRKVLLYGFMDSSTSPWSYKVIAYEPETNTWFGPYYIADSASDDAHWTPSLGALPDGRLVIMWGYDGEMKYRISTYSLKEETDIEKVLTNWGSTQTLTTDVSAYPRFMMWPDKTLLFKRNGSACNGYPDWWEWDSDQEKFVSKGKFCDVSTCYEYPKFVKIGDKILATWLNYTSCGVGNKKNVYFAYSPDKGNTWKKYDGTTITPPLSASDTLVKETPYDYTPASVYLDYNNRPIIVVLNRNNLEYLKTFTYEMWICYYTKALGESGGEWKLEPLRVSVGQLKKPGMFFRDEESSCLGIYTVDPGNNIFGKFLEADGEEHVWLRTKNIDSPVLLSDGTTFDDTIYPFEQLVTLRTKLMGKVEKGQTSIDPGTTIYASKFVPFRSGTITRIQVYLYTENDNYKVKVGIFDENWNLLGSSTWQEACSTNTAYEGFTYNGRLSPIEVEAGKTYYVACQCESGTYVRRIYRDSDPGGEIYTVGSWSDNPSKTLKYSNQSLTIVAEEDVPYFIGTGGITFFRTFQEGISFKEWWNTIFQTVLEFIQLLDSFSPRFVRTLEEFFNLVSTKVLSFRTYKNEWLSLTEKFLPIFVFKESLVLLETTFLRAFKRVFASSIFSDIIQKKPSKSLSEIIEYLDKFSKILTKIQSLFESLSFIDQLSKVFKFTLPELSALQESLKKRILTIKEEVIIFLEILRKVQSFLRYETFWISEAILKKVVAIQEESLQLVPEKLFRVLKKLSGEVIFLDLFSKVWSKGIQEILSITEVFLRKTIKALQESAQFKIQRSLIIKKSLSKSLNFIESLLLSQLLRFYQTLNLTDQSFYSLTKTLSEKITLSKIFLTKITKILLAKLSLLDIVSRKMSFQCLRN